MNSRIRLIFLTLALLLPALAQAGGTIPTGLKISVVTDQSVSSKTAKAGQTVTGSVAHNVTVDGKVVIPKGSPVKLTVSSVQASGRLSTPAKLYLRLRSVTVGGKTYTIATSSAGRTEGGKGKRDAGFIGGDGKEGHRVSRRDKASLHYTGRSDHQLTRIARREGPAKRRQPLLKQPRKSTQRSEG